MAVVIPRYAPIFGGAENQAALLARRLVEEGGATISFVVTKRISGALPRREIVDGVPVRRLGIPGVGRWSDHVFYLATVVHLLRRGRRFDLIHCHGSSLIGLLVAVVGKLVGKPVVVKLSTHGELLGSPVPEDPAVAPRPGWLRARMAGFARRSSHLVAMNREGEREILAAGGEGGYSVIPNGVDTDRFRPPTPEERSRARREHGISPQEVVFVYTGRFVERKGLDVLFSAWASAREEGGEDLRLVLAGSGALQGDSAAETVRRAATRLPGVTRVAETRQVLPVLHLADVFVFPSRREGMPNAVLEALAVGLPCLLSDIAPHREIAATNPDADVTLFETDSVPALAEGLLALRRRRRAGELAPVPGSLAAPYTLEAVTRRYAALYRRLVEESR